MKKESVLWFLVSAEEITGLFAGQHLRERISHEVEQTR